MGTELLHRPVNVTLELWAWVLLTEAAGGNKEQEAGAADRGDQGVMAEPDDAGLEANGGTLVLPE